MIAPRVQFWHPQRTPPNPGKEAQHAWDQYLSWLFGLWGYYLLSNDWQMNIRSPQNMQVVACNSILTLSKANAQWFMEPSETHYDLISAIKNLHKHLPLESTFQHVKGHQDHGQIMVLPWATWMNIEMDENAKHKVSLEGPHEQQKWVPFWG